VGPTRPRPPSNLQRPFGSGRSPGVPTNTRPIWPALLFLATIPASAEPPRYRVKVLSALDGMASAQSSPTWQWGPNGSGVTVGRSLTPARTHAPVRWSPDGRIKTLQTLPGGLDWGAATAVNDAGTAIGFLTKGWFSVERAVMWDASGVHTLPTLGHAYATAFAVNNCGTILGAVFDAFSYDDWPEPVVWNAAVPELLPLAGLPHAAAWAMNDHGTVGGHSSPSPGESWATTWRDGVATVLPKPADARFAGVQHLNDRGDAAGFLTYEDTFEQRAAFWRDGRLTEIPHFAGPSGFFWATYIGGLNNLGQLAGTSCTVEDWVPYLWENGTMFDLRPYVDHEPGVEFLTANGINDAGWILGTAMINGTQTGVLLTPVP
jgi:uncharacterized membrane protein